MCLNVPVATTCPKPPRRSSGQDGTPETFRNSAAQKRPAQGCAHEAHVSLSRKAETYARK